jgi:hypothetical protein
MLLIFFLQKYPFDPKNIYNLEKQIIPKFHCRATQVQKQRHITTPLNKHKKIKLIKQILKIEILSIVHAKKKEEKLYCLKHN